MNKHQTRRRYTSLRAGLSVVPLAIAACGVEPSSGPDTMDAAGAVDAIDDDVNSGSDVDPDPDISNDAGDVSGNDSGGDVGVDADTGTTSTRTLLDHLASPDGGTWASARLILDTSRPVHAEDAWTEECADATGNSCLIQECDLADGERCVYVAFFLYESTPSIYAPQAGPLLIDAVFAHVAPESPDEVPPVLIYNHGGTSLNEAEQLAALVFATGGYTVLASHYRGGEGSLSEGEIEGCLGEIDDVNVLAELAAQHQPAGRRGFLGGSHGGCVTLGAVLRGGNVHAAVAAAPGTDAARRYVWSRELLANNDFVANCEERVCDRACSDRNFIAGELVGGFEAAWGELPDWRSSDYNCDDANVTSISEAWEGREEIRDEVCARSPLSYVSELGDNHPDLMVAHGETDQFVRVEESCEFVGAVGDFATYRITADGSAASPEDNVCSGYTELSAAPPAPGFPGNRVFVTFESLDHGNLPRAAVDEPCAPANVAPDNPGPFDIAFEFLDYRLKD